MDAAERAVYVAANHGGKRAVRITRHGHFVIDPPESPIVDIAYHVLTINHATEPGYLADSMESCAIENGFDTGMRRGKKVRS